MNRRKTKCCLYAILVLGIFIIVKASISNFNLSNRHIQDESNDAVRVNSGNIAIYNTHGSPIENRDKKNNKLPSHNRRNYFKWENDFGVMKLNQLILNNVFKKMYRKRPIKN